MAYQPLKLRPGIDVEMSPHLNEGGFSTSIAIRFFEGLPQKLGGWLHLNNMTLTGIATGLHAWGDIDGNIYIAAGTDQRLQVFTGGVLSDITPIRLTTNNAPDFSTGIGLPTVTIHDSGSDAAVGDWVNIVIPVSVGGLIIQDYYQVTTAIDADNYEITATANATGNVSDGGAVPTFTTTNTSANVTVTLDNHGLSAGGTFQVQVATTVGGLTVTAGLYSIVGTPATNTFVITAGTTASSGDTQPENSGNAQIEYLLGSGAASSFYPTSGWGVGVWGGGVWGAGTGSTALVPLRQWFLDNFGQDLIGNYTGSAIYVWVPPVGTHNAAVPIDSSNYPGARQPPTSVNICFVSAPQQMIIALGCDDANTGDFEPLLVRWCNAGDFTDWEASVTNQAGSYLIPSGSKLVGGLSAPNFTCLWTDVDLWLMTYLGGTGLAELVWGFTKVSGGSGLLSSRAVGLFRNLVFYAAPNGFYMFDGNSIRLIPCPVWDQFWFNLNKQQVDKVNCQVNSYFQEVSWAFPSASGSGNVDSRVTYNIRENTWTYDAAPTMTARTAWIDENVYGAPIGTDMNGYLQQHEVSNDADGSALLSSVTTGWITISEGTLFTFIERLVGDFVLTGGDQTVQITVNVQDWPTDTIRTYGPYTWNPSNGPLYSIVRARGRYAQITIQSTGLGSFWRLGALRFLSSPAGRR